MPAPRVGFTLQPEHEFLELLAPVIAEADYYEVTPETTWRPDGAGALQANGFHRRFRELGAAHRRPFVAHGVGLSMGTSARTDAARQRRWLRRLAEDQSQFHYQWYTEHLGASTLDGLAMTLPLPLPMTRRQAGVVQRRLRAMQAVVPRVGVENNVAYFTLGAALEEATFLAQITAAPRMHLLLDVHNLFTMARNHGFDAGRYLEQLPLERVIEIHVSGGSDSEAAWLPSGRVLRLDSHDHAVPEEVWALLAAVLPRCRRVRGVTLERMEGTVAAGDVPLVAEELARVKAMVAAAWRRA